MEYQFNGSGYYYVCKCGVQFDDPFNNDLVPGEMIYHVI